MDIVGPKTQVEELQLSIQKEILDKIEVLEPCITVANCIGFLEYEVTDW